MTLAQLKRIFVPGFECLCTHNAKGPCSSPRRVEQTQTNAVAMSGPEYKDKLGWLYWPKASDVAITELSNGVELAVNNTSTILRYEWLPTHPPTLN